MKSFQERIKNVTIKGWISCAVSSIAYIAFIVWVAWGDWKSLAWIALLPVIIDAFTTKYINWGWWKKYKPITKEEQAKGIKRPQANKVLYTIFSWIDAILFALVAVYFINIYFFQNYQIPTSSLEKTLRVGDFLCVNKMCYGARVPNTPLSMPLVQHTMPWGGKSYFKKPQWEYKRLKGWDKVEKGDIVVFNFPAGDTVCSKLENPDIYTLRHILQTKGKFFLLQEYGISISSKDLQSVITRPVDRRENYVKRCVGTPGDTLQIINNVIYINGQAEPTHPYLQYNYIIKTDGRLLSYKYLEQLGISQDDYVRGSELASIGVYILPLTTAMKEQLMKNSHIVSIEIQPEQCGGEVYPLGHNNWTRDNYGPIYIPAKGDTVMITEENYWVYKRIADAYEFKSIKIGEPYVFEMDHYWMMGDNRHQSADSRYWGFVPEDHIVGRPMFVWLSIDKDKSWTTGRIRWNRIGLSNFE
jgi:signal peptidase I